LVLQLVFDVIFVKPIFEENPLISIRSLHHPSKKTILEWSYFLDPTVDIEVLF